MHAKYRYFMFHNFTMDSRNKSYKSPMDRGSDSSKTAIKTNHNTMKFNYS